jgi:hypothetical protein
MRKILLALLMLIAMPFAAMAQNNTDTYFYTPGGGGVNGAIGMCLNGTNPATARAVPCSDPTALPSPVTGTFSATLSGFTPNNNFATLTATNASASVALPSGAVVAFQNTGTTAVSCKLGIGSATAAANQVVIQASSTVFLTVGSNTFGACIDQTGSASNLVVLAGGSGLGAGFGGGGGGGGGGGAVTVADGSDVAEGATTDAAAAVGGTGSVSAKLREISSQLNAPFQAGGSVGASENHIGEVGGNLLPITNAMTTTSATTTTGQSIGGIQTLANAVRVSAALGSSGTSGYIQSVVVTFTDAVGSGPLDVYFYNATVTTGTNCQNDTAFVLQDADRTKVLGVVHVTDFTSSNTAVVAQANNLSIPFGLASSTSLFACVVARASFVIAGTANAALKVNVVRN